MCGVAGILSYSGDLNLIDGLIKMSQMMERRGPDDSGYLLLKGNEHFIAFDDATLESVKHNKCRPYFPTNDIRSYRDTRFSVGITHRRLSILDLSENGHQPMCDSSQKYWIGYNGEVYNYKDLKKNLIEKGHTFYGSSDTEVLLHAYIEWGENFVTKLNGMYSIFIIDLNKMKALFIRDRLGIKPLYYYQSQTYFLFASDIKSLLASGLCPREVNWNGLFHNYSFGVCPRPETCFKDVKSFEKGCITILDLKDYSLSEEFYWKVPLSTEYSSSNENDLIEELDHLLVDSIKIRSIADVPVSCFMSGGVDSTLVSSIAAKNKINLTSYTLGFNKLNNSMDETQEAISTAKMYGMNHVVHRMSSYVSKEDLEGMVECYEEPFYDISPIYIMSKFVHSQGEKVILNGLGGDELFAGYSYYKWLTLRKNLNKNKWLYKVMPSISFLKKIKRLQSAETISQYYVQRHESFCQSEKLTLFNLEALPARSDQLIFDKYITNNNFKSDLESLGYLDINCYLGDHHLYRGDSFTMKFSLETRFPILDHRIVEFASKTQPILKYQHGLSKYILRQVAKKYIHPSCLKMKKKGFSLPLYSSVKGNLKSKMIEAQNHLGSFEQFSEAGLKHFFDNGSMQQIWHLIMTSLWIKKFNLN